MTSENQWEVRHYADTPEHDSHQTVTCLDDLGAVYLAVGDYATALHYTDLSVCFAWILSNLREGCLEFV